MTLFGPLFGTTAVDVALDDRAWLTALGEVETALARACARAGVIDLAVALEIGATATALAAEQDPADLGRRAAAGGNPVIPFVESLREAVAGRADPAAVHLQATSQDILDSAAMLVASRALGVIVASLRGSADRAAQLAHIHRDTLLIGRTLLQQAVPTTFGALAVTWGSGLDRAVASLERIRANLPVSLGGAAGTMPLGFEVLAAFADELDLAVPAGVWHAERTVIAELAGALGTAAVAIAKPATDVVLLAQDELAEVREAQPGGSSAMPHKRNPIAAVTARAAAAQAPGLVATLLAGPHELQRAAGAWHAEWPALRSLLSVVGGAASRLRDSLTGLEVDAGAMRGRCESTDVGHATDLVDRYLEAR